MSWPEPKPGLVIQFSYLWKREADAGREEGSKDRPCAVIVATEHTGSQRRVIAVPITHSVPKPPEEGIELPAATKARLLLDDAHSWVIVSECNEFAWPGPDLRFVPGRKGGAFGYLPPAVFGAIRERFVARYRSRNLRLVARSD